MADIAIGGSLPHSARSREFLTALEHFVLGVLREKHREFKYESLDGLLPVLSRKLGPSEVEVFGMAILITDQTLTPLHVRLALSATSDEVDRLELRFGENDSHGEMKRTPYSKPEGLEKRLLTCDSRNRMDHINWRHHLAFGGTFEKS